MAASERRLMEAEDLFRLRLVSDPQLSPDGEQVAFVVKRTDREANCYYSSLWVVGAAGGEARPFTQGNQNDAGPRWSPDSEWLAFTSDRDKTCQLWRIPRRGGEASAMTHLDDGTIGEFRWSPDGSRIAFTYRPKPAWERKEAREAREKASRSTPPLVVRRLRWREEGQGCFGDERRHLFVLDLATGSLTQLTAGDTDEEWPAWSPDGSQLVFVSNRTPDPDRTPQFQDLWVVAAAGGEPSRVEAPAGPKGALDWSPDGRWLAYYGHSDVSDVWTPTDPALWVVPVAEGAARNLSAPLDRPVGDAVLADLRSFGGGWTGPVWSPDSSALTFLVSDRGTCRPFRVDLHDGRLEDLAPGFLGEVASLSLDRAGGQLAALIGDPLEPGDVYVAALGAGQLEFRRRTEMNRSLLGELELARPEEIATAGEGREVHGWLLRPPRAAAGERAPLILYIHGGPHTQYGWAMLHEFQLLAARGFAILYTNPPGSRGYGQAHAAAIRGDWGGPDYWSVMAATDYATTLPGIDPDRLGVTGGSYGGYLTNCIIGRTDRFRCAVTQRSVVNLHSMAGTCDFHFNSTEYFGGNAWDRPERLLAQSPLSQAAAVRTPLLILHSEGDLRCPIEQAEQWFAALKNLGVEVEFVRYPREANHGLSRSGPPDLRLDRLERIIGWMERWLMPDEGNPGC